VGSIRTDDHATMGVMTCTSFGAFSRTVALPMTAPMTGITSGGSPNGEPLGWSHPCRCSCPRWQPEGGSEESDTHAGDKIVRQVHRHVAETPQATGPPHDKFDEFLHEVVGSQLTCRLLTYLARPCRFSPIWRGGWTLGVWPGAPSSWSNPGPSSASSGSQRRRQGRLQVLDRQRRPATTSRSGG